MMIRNPNPTPGSDRRFSANTGRQAAPPVYRPQNSPVLQPNALPAKRPAGLSVNPAAARPPAPPVYRPQSVPPLQPKRSMVAANTDTFNRQNVLSANNPQPKNG